MIAFATAVSDWARYEREALPGIERAAEPDSLVLTRAGLSIATAYNEMMDEAAARPDLEGLALLHQDFELLDGGLPDCARRLFGDPRLGLIGTLGARAATIHLWPARRKLYGSVFAPGLERRFSTGTQEVDGVDGALIVAAPWVVRGVRFAEPGDGRFHGYDVDISLRVGALGGTAVCAEIAHYHHRAPKDDFGAQGRARAALAKAWDPALRPPEWGPAFQG